MLTPALGLGVGYSEWYAQQSKCSNVNPTTLGDEQNERGHDSLAQNDLGGEPNVAVLGSRLLKGGSRTLAVRTQLKYLTPNELLPPASYAQSRTLASHD